MSKRIVVQYHFLHSSISIVLIRYFIVIQQQAPLLWKPDVFTVPVMVVFGTLCTLEGSESFLPLFVQDAVPHPFCLPTLYAPRQEFPNIPLNGGGDV